MTEIRGALCVPAEERACYAAIHDDLMRSPGELDWVRWSGIAELYGAREALSGSGARFGPGVACYVIDLPSTWEELRSSRPPNLRESLRKCYRSLQRDGLAPSFEVVTEGARVEDAVLDFLRLHAARASLEDTVRHNNVFEHAASRAFLSDVCGRFAERGALRIFRLRLGDALAATRLGFVLGGCLYLYYSGFDPSFAKYGVATTVVAEAMKHAIGERLGSVNLSTGKDRSKLRWRPEEVMFHEALLFSKAPLGRVKYGAVSAAGRALTQSFVGRLLSRRAPSRAAA
jgi:CelD/BcsL family acetyltransferase involved in cellulose biosynthesis